MSADQTMVREGVCSTCQLRGLCLPDHLTVDLTDTISKIVKPKPPVPRGTYLFRQGDPMTDYYFLRTGSAKSIVDDGNGRESVMSFLLPTDLIGAGSLQQAAYSSSVVTLERSSFCAVPAKDLLALWSNDESVQTQFLAKVSNRIQVERHARIRLDHTTADQRVADFILELSDRMGKLGRDPDSLSLTMSRSDIGNYLGLASETISRILGRFGDTGCITVHVKQLDIVNRHRLYEIAGSRVAVE